MRNKKGITLLVLIVTIIVLLILAGVTLNIVIGSDGILKKASDTVENAKLVNIKEEIEVAITDIAKGYYMGDEENELFDISQRN